MSGLLKLVGMVILGIAAIWIIPMITGMLFKIGIAVIVIAIIAAVFYGNKLKKKVVG